MEVAGAHFFSCCHSTSGVVCQRGACPCGQPFWRALPLPLQSQSSAASVSAHFDVMRWCKHRADPYARCMSAKGTDYDRIGVCNAAALPIWLLFTQQSAWECRSLCFCDVSSCGLARWAGQIGWPNPDSEVVGDLPKLIAQAIHHVCMPAVLLSHCQADQLRQRQAAQLLQAHDTSCLHVPAAAKVLPARPSCQGHASLACAAEAARSLAHLDGAAAGLTAAAQAAAAEAATPAAATFAEPAAAAVARSGDSDGSAHGRRSPLRATARKTALFKRARITGGRAEQPAAASSSGGLPSVFSLQFS